MVLGLGSCAGEDGGGVQDAVTKPTWKDAGAEAAPMTGPPVCQGTKVLTAYPLAADHIECETDAFPPELCGKCVIMTKLFSKSDDPEPLTCIIVKPNCR